MSEQFQPPNQPPYDSPPPFTLPKEGSVWAGFGLSLLLHLLQIPIGIVLALFESELFMFSILFIGVSQLIYMIPAFVIAASKGKPHLVKGLIIGASIVFLLNAACTGVIFFSLSQGSFR
jgi:hypothetical protein